MGQYSIKDIEILSGVKAHTLRIWEQRYDFLKPKRTCTNIRYYDDDQLKHILNISMLNRNGVKISKIACMCKEELKKHVLEISDRCSEPDTLMDSMIHSMIDFDEQKFECTLSRSIIKHGFHETFTKLIFPLLNRTGMLWTTGVISCAEEHFISNLVRRKISVAIDNQIVRRNEYTKKFVLFLPEGESHELMLLFAEFVLREHNHEVAYIGNSLPFNEIESIYKSFKPNFLFSYLTVPILNTTLQEYINKLAATYCDIRILIGGPQLKLNKPTLPTNVFEVHCLHDIKACICPNANLHPQATA